MCKSSQIESDPVQQEEPENIQLDTVGLFTSAVYTIKLPKFLDIARTVSKESLSKTMDEIKKVNDIYPVVMSPNFATDPRISDMAQCIAQTSWSILDSQGYNMDMFSTRLIDFWCQEHHKTSAMDQHVHGIGIQIVGFYFIDVPENTSNVVFHDPRPGKIQVDLPERDMSKISFGSKVAWIKPEPGLCVFSNSWLPHSFTRNGSKKPLRFIHFNVGIEQVMMPQACNLQNEVEVI